VLRVVLDGPKIILENSADLIEQALYGGPADGLKWAQQQLIDSADDLDWADLKRQA
jgi:hypothetical protein